MIALLRPVRCGSIVATCAPSGLTSESRSARRIGTVPLFPLGLILHEKDPSLSICTNSHALIADTQSVLSGASGYLHDHLPLFFGVPRAGMKLHCFSVAPRKSQGVGEVKQGGFCDLLARH